MRDDEAFQLELEARRYREDQLISRLRRECSGFRRANDEFTAEFNQAQSRLKQELANEQH